MQLKEFYGKGCRVCAAHVLEATEYDTPRLEGFDMLQEFRNVLPDEILRLPPRSDIKFTFELVHGAAPVSQTSCRMIISEILELKNATTRVVGKESYQAKCVPLGSTSVV